MRRKDREMDKEFALHIVDKCEYAVLSMMINYTQSYCIPLSIVRIDNFIYFHCALEGTKTTALKNNPNVCLCCTGNTHKMEDNFTTEFESSIVFGKAEEVHNASDKINILKKLCIRHTPTNMQNFDSEISKSLKRTSVWKISIDSISGKCKKIWQQRKRNSKNIFRRKL